eukprot:COSAG06_NODE_8830_length_2060_cov_2.579898_1_plen_107_part_00
MTASKGTATIAPDKPHMALKKITAHTQQVLPLRFQATRGNYLKRVLSKQPRFSFSVSLLLCWRCIFCTVVIVQMEKKEKMARVVSVWLLPKKDEGEQDRDWRKVER